ncbi:NADH-quinone oxidoreductase subunit NuoN [Microvirga roseola]|uniref:NADH-quinone oxidoreductase subunit NuoN n=1 Tax=Microvirga roseola TaxID=2883126 RepID=UPI001E64A0E8|nr:NADH-quinone oxidoreductase subunit NuoN [Microvirga roseola]
MNPVAVIPVVAPVIPAFWPMMPEIILAAGALLLVLFGAFRGDRANEGMGIVALALLVVAFVAVLMLPSERVETMMGSFVIDPFAKFMKALVLLGSAGGIILSTDYMRREGILRFEYPILIVLATIGMMMVISANDLIALYLGLELLSLSSYVIAAFDRDNVRSTEAGLKYFVLGALSSGMLLYGASLVYGFTGTVSFPAMALILQGEVGAGAIFGLVFVAAGIAFKISAVPFHMWTPDVYEGSPTPVTAFFAAAPKMAGMAMATRVFIDAFPGILVQWQQIIVFISIASMALGSFAAIGQRNIKRLMAYSSIGNIGYALIGLAAGTPEGVQGVVVYMAIYLAMTLGAFAVILGLRRGNVMFETVDDLSGLARTHPALAFCLAAMMFSLAGIPPLAGFFAKFYVFAAAIEAGLVALAVIGVVTSVIGAYYYLRIVKVMYFDAPVERFERMSPGQGFVLAVSSVVVLLFWLVPAPIVNAAGAAARSLF